MDLKRIVGIFVAVLFGLAACGAPEVGIEQVKKIPNDVNEQIDFNAEIQLHNDGEHRYYVIFQSDFVVTATVEKQNDTVIVKFDESNEGEDEEQRQVYLLTTDEDVEVIEVFVNGEATAFDLVS